VQHSERDVSHASSMIPHKPHMVNSHGAAVDVTTVATRTTVLSDGRSERPRRRGPCRKDALFTDSLRTPHPPGYPPPSERCSDNCECRSLAIRPGLALPTLLDCLEKYALAACVDAPRNLIHPIQAGARPTTPPIPSHWHRMPRIASSVCRHRRCWSGLGGGRGHPLGGRCK
jgi:hypothetical protein